MPTRIEQSVRNALTPAILKLAELNRKRLPDGGDNPFMRGIHTPIEDETTLTGLKVTGIIPEELDGRYVRIGPNPVGKPARGHHWFVGDGMVHGVRLSGGRAHWYRNRFIRSRDLAAKTGVRAAPGPRRGFGDTVNTNIMRIGETGSRLGRGKLHPRRTGGQAGDGRLHRFRRRTDRIVHRASPSLPRHGRISCDHL